MFGKLAQVMIQLYRVGISSWMRPCCRFYPSCSAYTLQAIQIHGVRRGIFLGIKRIIRCNPWGNVGYDPVPERLSSRKERDT